MRHPKGLEVDPLFIVLIDSESRSACLSVRESSCVQWNSIHRRVLTRGRILLQQTSYRSTVSICSHITHYFDFHNTNNSVKRSDVECLMSSIIKFLHVLALNADSRTVNCLLVSYSLLLFLLLSGHSEYSCMQKMDTSDWMMWEFFWSSKLN